MTRSELIPLSMRRNADLRCQDGDHEFAFQSLPCRSDYTPVVEKTPERRAAARARAVLVDAWRKELVRIGAKLERRERGPRARDEVREAAPVIRQAIRTVQELEIHRCWRCSIRKDVWVAREVPA